MLGQGISHKVIIIGAVTLFFYFLFVNTVPYLNLDGEAIQSSEILKSSGFVQEISFGNSLEVIVERNRWYGKIIEEGIYQDIYLLGLVKFPKKYKEFNFMPLHLIFFIFYFETLFLLNEKWRKNGKKTDGVV